MTYPPNLPEHFIAIKYFLSSYRALSDCKNGINLLQKEIELSQSYFSDWEVLFIGTCSLLRTSIDLFKFDSKSCINSDIRKELLLEWKSIKEQNEKHEIYWNFIQLERNNILHEYQWSAYEVWLDQEGNEAKFGLLTFEPKDHVRILTMKKGYYKGRNSLDLLREGAAWAEARIFEAIRRAGFDPDEERSMRNFQPRPARAEGGSASGSILGGALTCSQQHESINED